MGAQHKAARRKPASLLTERPAGRRARRQRRWQRGDLARATGVHPETIRYYEHIGLLPPPPRRPNGYREYDERHLRRLLFIARARGLGFSLDEVRSLLALAEGSAQDCARVQQLTAAHLADINRRIQDLQRIAAILEDHLQCCRRSTRAPACPFLETLFTAETPDPTARGKPPMIRRKAVQAR